METAKFYWTVAVGIVGAVWIIVQLIRDRNGQSISRTNAAVNRLIAMDQLIINSPDTQRYLSETSKQGEAYFREEARLKEELFYKAKTLVYMHLNTFDEILSLSTRPKGRLSLLGPGMLIEPADWEQYILVKLRHPLYCFFFFLVLVFFGVCLRWFL